MGSDVTLDPVKFAVVELAGHVLGSCIDQVYVESQGDGTWVIVRGREYGYGNVLNRDFGWEMYYSRHKRSKEYEARACFTLDEAKAHVKAYLKKKPKVVK